jgi:hypothetical protein
MGFIKPTVEKIMDKIKKNWTIYIFFFVMFLIASPVSADKMGWGKNTAYLYEVSVYGTFGDTINPDFSNLPDSTYPFPDLRGGSFEGIFIYDSFASLGGEETTYTDRFQYTYASMNIMDKYGIVVNNIDTSPNGFLVTSTNIQLTFGSSGGIIYGIEDLRLNLGGAFTVGETPPPVDQLIAGVLEWGFLETDGIAPFTYWDLPITEVTFIHTATYPYKYKDKNKDKNKDKDKDNDKVMAMATVNVPEPSTMLLLGSGLVGLAEYRRRKK